jgi:cation diffusion facilitator family transporter
MVFSSLKSSPEQVTTELSNQSLRKKEEQPTNHHQSDLLASKLGVVVDTLLVIAKGAVGLSSGSAALTADAAHSGADMFSSAVVHMCVKQAQLPADVDHPYGHGKIQSLGTLTVGAALIATGAGIAYHSSHQIMNLLNELTSTGQIVSDITSTNPDAMVPAILVAAGSVLAKEALYR